MFHPKNQNFELSPYTGMTRESWIEAGIYLLDGVFGSIPDVDAPVLVPRQETEITYPNAETPPWKVQAEYFEGLTRTFLIAAPLIHENPELEIHGIRLRDYYRKQILRSVTPGDPNYVRTYTDMQREFGEGNPFAVYQQTVESASLVIGLELCCEEIWESFTKEERDLIASFLADYAKNPTVPQNWRLFNMLDYAFLYRHGYPVDEEIMRDHALVILNDYAGNGWYRDGHGFDYYSCWAFNVYSMLWNRWYGYEKEPYLSARFEENSNRLMETYAKQFDRDGFMNMWGRSGIYRFAAVSPFAANRMGKHPTVDPGLARRISSGALLQFLNRDDFFYKGVPTLGFYGQFLPLVQSYSCAESPYWMGKAFLCLALPAEDPFWTERERNGDWEQLHVRASEETVLNGPGLCITEHGATGSVELRTGKVFCSPVDQNGIRNYGKLVYHTKFPWEDAPGENVETQQYLVLDPSKSGPERANVTFWAGMHDGVLYRRQYFSYDARTEPCWLTGLDLADFAVPYGIFRVDRLRSCRAPLTLTLGSYGFPDNGTEIIRREYEGAAAVILKGHDHTGKEKQLAMTVYGGWDELKTVHSSNTNPDSKQSVVVFAEGRKERLYGYEKYVFLSQVITKESLEDFSEEELFPVQELEFTDPEGCGGYGPIRVKLKDGNVRKVDFSRLDGNLQI